MAFCTSVHVVLVHHTGWSVTIDEGDSGVERISLTLFNLRRHRSSEVPHVFYALKVFNDFSWAVYVVDKMVCGVMVDFVRSKIFILSQPIGTTYISPVGKWGRSVR